MEIVVGSSVLCAGGFCEEIGGALPSLALTTREGEKMGVQRAVERTAGDAHAFMPG